MSVLEIIIVASVVGLAVAYVIFQSRRKRSHGAGCEGHCGCGKAAPMQSDRRR